MSRIEWSSRLETGIPIIDSQHKNLIKMINELSAVLEKNNQALIESGTDNIIGRLYEYVDFHFKTEEELFLKYNYIDGEAHTKAHDNLRQIAGDFYNRFAKGEDVSHELLAVLEGWIEGHIISSDMKYIETFNDLVEKKGY